VGEALRREKEERGKEKESNKEKENIPKEEKEMKKDNSPKTKSGVYLSRPKRMDYKIYVYLTRGEEKIMWDCEDCAENGYVLIDLVNHRLILDYQPPYK
jgi:hypothetical protein